MGKACGTGVGWITGIYEASERDFRIVLVKDAISQLYPKGEEEMKNIGVCLLTTHEINRKNAWNVNKRI
jgi:hypothetical protein